ncbi:MAG: MarR family winged helix-turn-helix transcriptional regulator [Novosphingobium sp.]
MSVPKPPRSQDELESYLPYLVNRLAVLGQAVQNRQLSANGINLVILRTLSILHIEDALTINEIAARTFTEQSSTSRAIDAMVSQGLVERRIPERDQRQRVIALTPLGREQLFNNWPAMAEYFDVLSEGISAAERNVLRDMLIRMLANLERLGNQG